MLFVHDAWNTTDLPTGGVVTIGNFDGVHRGQQAILRRVVERARTVDGPAVVVTFDPHPLTVLRPGEEPERLTTDDQKRQLLLLAGIDAVLSVRFTQEIAAIEAERFVRELLHRRLAAQEVYVGSRFSFGRDRRGDVALLERLGAELGFVADGVDEVACDGSPISSTRIRRALLTGAVEQAAEMLGRPYAIEGSVVRGDRMGKRLGWPTINIEPENELIPLDGVYACQVAFGGFAAEFVCATNIGTRPTVYENFQRVVESHVLDFSSDVYGQSVVLAFHRRLREERIFPTIMDLSAQIHRDVAATREYFASRRGFKENDSLLAQSPKGSESHPLISQESDDGQ